MPVRVDPASRLTELIDALEPRLRRRFVEAMFLAKSRLTLEVLVGLLESNRVQEALDVVDRTFQAFASEVLAGFVGAGVSTSNVIAAAIDAHFVFNQVNHGAVLQMQRNRLQLVHEFSEEQRRATREALIEGVRAGVNPREQARAFRGSIGLTERQVQAVQNYRGLLETGSREALDRALRDRRFDPTVSSAIDEGRVLDAGQIDRMVERYEERYLKYRSEVIARTEALRAVHEGSQEAYRQAFEAGDLDPQDVTREWSTAGDERVRESHAAMEGQEVGVGEPFISGDGNRLMYPGDPSAPAEDVIQCRCSVGTRIDVSLQPGESIQVSTIEDQGD